MFPNHIGVSGPPPTAGDEVGTTKVDAHPVATLEHRTFVHPVTRADCLECLPAPCVVCGRPLCPDAFEHRRDHMGAEVAWMEAAR